MKTLSSLVSRLAVLNVEVETSSIPEFCSCGCTHISEPGGCGQCGDGVFTPSNTDWDGDEHPSSCGCGHCLAEGVVLRACVACGGCHRECSCEGIPAHAHGGCEECGRSARCLSTPTMEELEADRREMEEEALVEWLLTCPLELFQQAAERRGLKLSKEEQRCEDCERPQEECQCDQRGDGRVYE